MYRTKKNKLLRTGFEPASRYSHTRFLPLSYTRIIINLFCFTRLSYFITEPLHCFILRESTLQNSSTVICFLSVCFTLKSILLIDFRILRCDPRKTHILVCSIYRTNFQNRKV